MIVLCLLTYKLKYKIAVSEIYELVLSINYGTFPGYTINI